MKRALLGLVVLLAAACGGTERDEPAQLASGKALPARCVPGDAGRGATVTFVANGYAWALEPGRRRLTCLFAARHPGPFEWGPRADRALLARLEVRSLGHGPSRPPGTLDPPAASWGRPTGKSIVFVGRNGRALLKAHPAGGGFLDVTPVRGARYERVVYHPSGLAFAFVLRRGGRESIWISSNVGKQPEQLVHGRLHTGFEALAFGDAGSSLYFAARHADGHVDVHVLPLTGATSAPVVWRGRPGEHVSDVLPGWAGLGLTVGRSCATRRAVFVTSRPKEALPGHRPSRAVGWIADRRLLVAVGGCGRPLDLYAVDPQTLRAELLARNVEAAAVRRAEPLPPPPLPRAAGGRSSFA